MAIVLTSAVICLAMLYVMLRMWCNWRRVSVSNMDGGGGGAECKREEELWDFGNEKKRGGECWNVVSLALVNSKDEEMQQQQHALYSTPHSEKKMPW